MVATEATLNPPADILADEILRVNVLRNSSNPAVHWVEVRAWEAGKSPLAPESSV
ncbi:MAG: hypothetical protein NTW21_30190 [Verrucomicrobia bacterium]|nr:hypothetical protein [Verrucomicrobiota bacterium]